MKTFIKELGSIFGKMLVAIIILFVLFMSMDAVLEWTLPDDYLFYESQKLWDGIFLLLGVLGASIFPEFHGDWKELWEKHRGGCIAFLLVVFFYIVYFMTSVACVTPDTIVSRSLLNPKGASYQLEEIERIETGFGEEKGFFKQEYEKLGNFYYKVFVDGKELVFHVPTPNNDIDRYMEDSYLELEEFDQKLVSLGIPKKGNPDGSGLCNYDQYYVDRFLRIIGEN